jgi:hypothetical protein
MLTDRELDIVTGGQADPAQATNLAGIHVNATSIANPNIVFSLNTANFSPSVGNPTENGGIGFGSANITYPSAVKLPSSAYIECVINATAEPNFGWYDVFEMVRVNDYMFIKGHDLTDTYVTPNNSAAAVYNNALNGQTQSYPPGGWADTTITTGAYVGWSGTRLLTSPAGVTSNPTVTMNPTQHLIFVGAHETAHQHGVGNGNTDTDESKADWYGYQAEERYRANPALINGCAGK